MRPKPRRQRGTHPARAISGGRRPLEVDGTGGGACYRDAAVAVLPANDSTTDDTWTDTGPSAPPRSPDVPLPQLFVALECARPAAGIRSLESTESSLNEDRRRGRQPRTGAWAYAETAF